MPGTCVFHSHFVNSYAEMRDGLVEMVLLPSSYGWEHLSNSAERVEQILRLSFESASSLLPANAWNTGPHPVRDPRCAPILADGKRQCWQHGISVLALLSTNSFRLSYIWNVEYLRTFQSSYLSGIEWLLLRGQRIWETSEGLEFRALSPQSLRSLIVAWLRPLPPVVFRAD